mmetsp:Transcript_5722/g.8094  ORF Transcript_5722/g.8094 Transcript_5722/m.8094 type:complete len:369 (-) Transcript_5722:80-1186(-)
MSVDGGALHAALKFLFVTLRNHHWAIRLDGSSEFEDLRNTILTELSKIQEDLSVLRVADKNVAMQRFTRGFDLLLKRSDNDDDDEDVWREDLTSALDSAEHGYHRVKTTAEKILCFQIMCSCFLVLRTPESAIISIRNQMKALFCEKSIQTALEHLERSVCEKAALSKEDKELLELFFSRVCGVIASCEQLDAFVNHRRGFRDLFAIDPIKNATYPEVFKNWKEIPVYTHSTKVRIAGTAAHGIVPIVPVVCGLTTLLSGGLVRPRNAGVTTLNTTPLHLYDEKQSKGREPSNQQSVPNLYDFRWKLLDLAHCDSTLNYALGNVSLTEHSEGWSIEPSPSEKRLGAPAPPTEPSPSETRLGAPAPPTQ